MQTIDLAAPLYHEVCQCNQSPHVYLTKLAYPHNHEEPQSSVQIGHRQGPKVGRNDACPCGSGKKYKQCHGKL